MTALNVLVTGLHFSPEETGNAPYTTGLAQGLAERGHRVHVLTGVPHYPAWKVFPGYEQWTSVEGASDRLTVTRLRHYVPSQPSAMRRVLMETGFGVRAASRKWGTPDVVLAVSPALISTALAVLKTKRLRRRPALGLWLQDLYSQGMVETGIGQGAPAKAARLFESSVVRAADGVAVIHEKFGHRLVEDLGVDQQRVKVIRNWTHLPPLDVVDSAKFRARWGWAHDEMIILHAGNMGAKQGLENVVQAARHADMIGAPVRFVLMGDGNQRAKLQAASEGVQRLSFVPPLPGKEFHQALQAADVLLVNEKPGVANMSVPSKLTSYFHAGRPVLAATELGGTTASELRAARAGLRVDPGKPQKLLSAAIDLAGDVPGRATMAENGKHFARTVLTKDTAIDAYEEWIHQLAANAGKG